MEQPGPMTASDSPELDAPHIAALLAKTPFAAAMRMGAPLLVAAADPLRLAYANASAMALFGAADFGELDAAATGASPGARRLRELPALLRLGAPPQLELLCFFAGRKPLTINLSCLRVADPAGRTFIAAAALGSTARAAPQAPAAAPASPAAAIAPPFATAGRFLWSVDEALRFAPFSAAPALGDHAPRRDERLEDLKKRIG